MLQDAWGFNLEELDFPNIHIWHGTKDQGCPLSMARVLEEKIKDVKFNVVKDEGHLTLVFNKLDEILERL